MKKIILGAVALAAENMGSAQSSVTIFGILDTGVGYGSGSLSHVTKLYSIGNHAPSRIGFRGAEDLGAGLKAGF